MRIYRYIMGVFATTSRLAGRSIVRKFGVNLEDYIHKRSRNVLEKELTLKDKLDMTGNKIKNVGEPKDSNDATNKRYVYLQIQKNTRSIINKTNVLENKTKNIEDSLENFRKGIEGNVKDFIEGAEERINELNSLIEENNKNIENVQKTIEECLEEIIKLEENSTPSDKPESDECGLVKSLKIQKDAIKELREVNERNSDIRQRLHTLEDEIKTTLRTSIDNINDRLSFLRTDYNTLLTNYSDLRDDLKTLTDNHETLTNKESDDNGDLLEKYNNLNELYKDLERRYTILNRMHEDNTEGLKEEYNILNQSLLEIEEKLINKNEITRLKNSINQVSRLHDDDVFRFRGRFRYIENQLNERRDEFNNHIKYAEGLKNDIDNIQRYTSMIEKSKILMAKSKVNNKTIRIFYHSDTDKIRAKMMDRDTKIVYYETNGVESDRFLVIVDYFNNFSFSSSKDGFIVPNYDFYIVIDFIVNKLEINPSHPSHIRGTIFTSTIFRIDEISILDGKIISTNLYASKIGEDDLRRIVKRIHLKKGKKYSIDFLHAIRQHILDHKDESYDIDIDFTLRLYYTTDKDRNFDEEYLWKDIFF